MFGKLFASLKAHNNNNQPEKIRRTHTRREGDQCVGLIEGKIYPVQNWSLGGLQIRADERFFSLQDEFPVTLKFKLGETLKDVSHLARVVRKNNGFVAFQFAPLTRQTRSDFQAVVSDYMAAQFASSQGA